MAYFYMSRKEIKKLKIIIYLYITVKLNTVWKTLRPGTLSHGDYPILKKFH